MCMNRNKRVTRRWRERERARDCGLFLAAPVIVMKRSRDPFEKLADEKAGGKENTKNHS